MLSYFRTLLHWILLVILFQKGFTFYKTGELFVTNLDIPFVMIPVFLLFVIGWTDGKSLNSVTDDSEYEEVSWTEYWENIDYDKTSLFWDIFAWVVLFISPALLIYGFYQNDVIYNWSKYAIIFLQVIAFLILVFIPTFAIIRMIESQKILNILSIVSNLIILIFSIYVGDWLLAIVMFSGLMIFLNKVFA